MTYERQTYQLTTFTLTVPAVRNDGQPSGYLPAVRDALAAAGFGGWTETASVGYWLGKLEPGHVLTIYAPPTFAAANVPTTEPTADVLGRIGRAAMPDQDAIQVTIGATVELVEA